PLPPTEVPEVAAAVLPPDIVAEIDADAGGAIDAEVRRRLDGGATLDELAEVARASELYTAKSVVAVLRARWRKWAKARRQAATRPTGAVSASESVAWGAPASTDPEAVEGAQRPAEARQGVCVSSLGKRASATALEAAARGVIGTLADRPTGLERRALLRAVGELVLAGWPPDHLASCLRHDGTEDVATIKRRAGALAVQSVPTFEDATRQAVARPVWRRSGPCRFGWAQGRQGSDDGESGEPGPKINFLASPTRRWTPGPSMPEADTDGVRAGAADDRGGRRHSVVAGRATRRRLRRRLRQGQAAVVAEVEPFGAYSDVHSRLSTPIRSA